MSERPTTAPFGATRARAGALLVALGLAAAGCANPAGPDASTPAPDAAVDAGVQDAGPPDGGAPVDAGHAPDAGPKDAGPRTLHIRRASFAPAVERVANPRFELRGRLGASAPTHATSPGYRLRGGLRPTRTSTRP